MVAPIIIYGAITGARFALAVYKLREKQEKTRRMEMSKSTFTYEGGAVFHEYC